MIRPAAAIWFIIMAISTINCQNELQHHNPSDRIVLAFQVSRQFAHQQPANIRLQDKFTVEYRPINCIDCSSDWMTSNAPVSEGSAKFELFSNEPLQINYGFGQLFMVGPGDSIHIFYDGNEPIYTGSGAEKLNAWSKAKAAERLLPLPTKNNFTINSLNDYLRWDQYADEKITCQLVVIDSFATKMGLHEYNHLKSMVIGSAERDRIHAFQGLVKYYRDTGSTKAGIDLDIIWDSTQYKPWSKWLRSLPAYYGNIRNLYTFNRMEVQRRFHFDPDNDSITNKELRTWLYYTLAKESYLELSREKLLAYILDEPTITEMGLKNPMTQKLLADYYSQPGFPEYKLYVKQLEKKAK